jgi:NAD(P)-dependent dehydrogenase (short-subunit alcohol dehydrogenase family)
MLNGQVVAITGGTRGIGLATARAFAERGARVAIGGTDTRALADLASGLGFFGATLDVRGRQSCVDFFTEVENALGPIDVLVNNAGICHTGHLVGTDPVANDRIIDVNLRGVLHAMEVVLPRMLSRRRGKVINVSSLSGRMPAAGVAVYSATKHALIGLSLAVRDEILGSGAGLTVVLPTFVTTEMVAGVRLRGLPRVNAATVACAIVRAAGARRQPAVVTVPRWLGPAPFIVGLLPRPLTDAIKQRVNADATKRVNRDERAIYQDRINQALRDGPSIGS